MRLMDKTTLFHQLAEEAAACTLCPAMLGRSAVFSSLNGTLHPRALLVAEAPGRQGADRTRIPFHGDASGRNFERLMASIGLQRAEVFITNAVMCSPRSTTGANRTPTANEARNCSTFLRRTVELLNPPVVVSIGGFALKALARIEPHTLTLEDVGCAVEWFGRRLVPMYHPSPQVVISSRSLPQQLDDWKKLGEVLESCAPRS